MDYKTNETKSVNRPRDEKKNENFRKKIGRENDTKKKHQIYEGLLFGYKDYNEVIKGMHIVGINRTIYLPISSRGIGMTIRYLMRRLTGVEIKGVDHRFCCALYRIALTMLEAKLSTVQFNITSRNRPVGFRSTDITLEKIRKLGELGANFSPIANIIGTIGPVNAFGGKFIPLMYKESDVTTVNIANLWKIVERLSKAETPLAERQAYYKRCPFPNARWKLPGHEASSSKVQRTEPEAMEVETDVSTNPVLDNPNDIMTANYNMAGLQHDINIIMDVIQIISRKYPKYVSEGRLDYAAEGNHSLLVSSECGDIRCNLDWSYSNDKWVPDYLSDPLVGNHDHFWSSENIGEPELYFGVLHLTGELLYGNSSASIYHPRSMACAKKEVDFEYESVLANMIG